jgi:hypothetical protein
MKKMNKTDKELKEIGRTILDLKYKGNDICPKCGNLTKYGPNPMYMHICETCGEQMSMNDLIHKSDLDYVVDILKKEFINGDEE